MNKTVVLSDSQINAYIDFLYGQQDDITSQIAALQSGYNANAETIKSLTSKEDTISKFSTPKFDKNGYDKNASVWLKVKYILSKTKEPLSSKDILREIIHNEPNLANDRKFKINVFSVLSTKAKLKIIDRLDGPDNEIAYIITDKKQAAVEAA